MYLPMDVRSITPDLLEKLVSEKRAEDMFLEYKETLPYSHDDVEEFLKDVTALANAVGGHLLYGISADSSNKALPHEIVGLGSINSDKEIRRLDDLLQSRVEPRLRVHIKIVSVAGKVVIAIIVHRSWVRPHAVRKKTAFLYPMRNSTGTYWLNVEEVRNIFQQTGAFGERIRRFRAERVALVEMGEGPRDLELVFDKFRAVLLHLIPFATLDDFASIDPYHLANSNLSQNRVLTPLFGAAESIRTYTFDGLLSLGSVASLDREYQGIHRGGSVTSYLQVFRNGVCEIVDTYLLRVGFDPAKQLVSPYTEGHLVAKVLNLLEIYKAYQIPGPISVLLSVIGADDYYLTYWERHPSEMYKSRVPFRNREMLFEEVVLVDVEQSFDTVSIAMKPMFDRLWNAAGLERCRGYSESNGLWTPRFDGEGNLRKIQ